VRALRAGIFILLALAGSAGWASAASADEPIEGTWKYEDGRIVEFFATGPNAFGERVIQSGSKRCSDKDSNIRLTGSDLRYSGNVTYYRTSDCQPVGDGRLTITLEPDALQAKSESNPPPGFTCCTADETIVRVGAPPLSAQLPVIVNRLFAGLLGRYNQIRRTSSSRRRKGMYNALRAAAVAADRRIRAYPTTDPDLLRLKAQALRALMFIGKGGKNRSASLVVSGLTTMRTALRPFVDLLPGGKAGTTPTSPPAKPGEDPDRGHFVGQGEGVSRIEFDIASGKATNFNFVVLLRCTNGEVGYLESPKGPGYNTTLDSQGRFAKTRQADTTKIDVAGTVTGGRASGTVRWYSFFGPDRPGGDSTTCDSGVQKWKAGVK
jgi:hypothetical protein